MRRTVALMSVVLGGLALVGIAFAGLNDNWSTHLKGRNENPPRDTNAQGQAIFHLNAGGQSVDYKLIASNIENAFMAHIHCGSSTVNGPIVVWLYPSTAPVAGPAGQGRTDGVLAQGTFTDANVIDRAPSPECPTGVSNLGDVLALLNSGGAYVNVHTNDGDATPNEGPGDFPGGEIRNQVD